MRNLGSVLILSVGVLGCGDGVDSDEEDFTQSKKLTLLEGPELVSCRVEKGPEADPFFRKDRVLCKLAPKTDFPLQPSRIFVSVLSKKGSAGSADITSETEAVVASVFASDAYPLDIEIGASYSISDEGDLTGLGSGFFSSFSSRHTVIAPTSDALSARFPFDLWPIEIRATNASFEGSLAEFKVDLAPMKTSSNAPTLDVKAHLGNLQQGDKKFALIPVTHGTTRLAGEGTFDGKKLPFELAGPGSYIAEPTGLRGATEADLTDISGGPSFATCWTEPAAAAGELDVLCRRGEVAGIALDSVEVLVGEELSTATVGATLTDLEVTKIATVPAASMPVSLWGRTTLQSPAVVGLPEWQGKESFAVSVAIDVDATAMSPKTVTLPFDVWPITVDAAQGSFLCDLEQYAVPLGVELGGVSLIKVEGASTPFINEGEQSTFFVIADSRVDALACKGLIITNSGDVTENVPVSLVRGGSYRVGAKAIELVP